MALTPEQTRLLNFARAVLPSWFTSDERIQEYLSAVAVMTDGVIQQHDDWFKNTLITTAVGPTGNDPDWLNQHAVDRGTSRQDGELDVALRARIRSVPDALTRDTIIAAAQAIIDAEAIPGTVAMVELPRDRAFFRTSTSDTGTGGTFTAPDVDGNMTFVPDAGFALGPGGVVVPPFKAPTVEERVDTKLVISGAADANNDGTFPITGMVGDAVEYQNPAGSGAADAGATWTVQKFDRDGNLLDGFQDSYFNRGDRMASSRPSKLILILPFGCTPGTEASVREMLRQKKGAGVLGIIECRLNP